MPAEVDRDDKPALIQAAMAVLFAIVLIACAFFCFRAWYSRSDRDYALGTNTWVMLNNWGSELKNVKDYGKFPTPLEGGLDGRPGSRFVIPESFLDQNGRILDFWKRPIIYRIHPGTLGRPKPQFELYSAGSNGLDEGGQGDDIKWDSFGPTR